MLGLVDGLAEQVKEGLFAVLDTLVLPELDTRGGDGFASETVEVTFEAQAYLLEFFEIICTLDVFHDLHDLALFGSRVEDGLLGDFFALELVKVIRNTSHQAQFRDQQNLKPSFPVLHLQEWLLGFANSDIVLGLVVIQHIGLFATCELLSQVLVHNILNLVVPTITVVDLDDLVLEGVLDNVSLVLAVTALVLFVKLVYEFEDSLVADDLFGTVHSEEYAFLEHYEVGLESWVHVQVVDLSFCFDVEEFACAADLRVSGLAHHSSEFVVEEEEKSLRVVFGIDGLDFLDGDLVLLDLEFGAVLFGFLVTDQVHAANGWVGNHGLYVIPACLENLFAFLSVVPGDHGFELDWEDEEGGKVLSDFDLKVVGEDVDRAEVVGVGAFDTLGEFDEFLGLLLDLHEDKLQMNILFRSRKCRRFIGLYCWVEWFIKITP